MNDFAKNQNPEYPCIEYFLWEKLNIHVVGEFQPNWEDIKKTFHLNIGIVHFSALEVFVGKKS